MLLGESKITRKEKLDPTIKQVLLTNKFFDKDPTLPIPTGLTQQELVDEVTNFFPYNEPRNEYDSTILKMLDQLKYDYTDKLVEYWFQHKVTGTSLGPHRDYNHHVRVLEAGQLPCVIDGSVPLEKKVSPITIIAYLEISKDLLGGQFCISHEEVSYEREMGMNVHQLLTKVYESNTPKEDDIWFFEGSKYFHWINQVSRGSRKSVVVNFWPLNLVED